MYAIFWPKVQAHFSSFLKLLRLSLLPKKLGSAWLSLAYLKVGSGVLLVNIYVENVLKNFKKSIGSPNHKTENLKIFLIIQHIFKIDTY